MTEVTFGGAAVRLCGALPNVGEAAPDFQLANGALADVSLADFAGKRKILSVNPSLDTGTCAASAREFNRRAAALEDVVILNISMDLPFAAKRFCEAEGLANVIALSAFRAPAFAADYGVGIMDGPLRGLLARAVLVLDGDNVVGYAQLVGEIKTEPDYDAALAAVGAA